MSPYSITLQSGEWFDISNLENNKIVIEDIAHSLSHLCRYTGHCKKFYSVAEHSVLVSQVCNIYKLDGLLHDASEAFIGDVASPLKKLLPDYKEIEKRITQYICRQFSLSYSLPEEVCEADRSVMYTEWVDLMPTSLEDWARGARDKLARVDIRCLSPEGAKKLFLDRYYELVDKDFV